MIVWTGQEPDCEMPTWQWRLLIAVLVVALGLLALRADRLEYANGQADTAAHIAANR